MTDIELWFRQAWKRTPAPIMSSVDLRNAGFKLAPVDTNVFPAGFNNLNPNFLPLCVQAMQSTISTWYPNCRRVLLVPEAHTRNLYYAESLSVLTSIITQAGFDVSLGHWENAFKFDNGLTVEKIERKGNQLSVSGVVPCLVILNNDLSSGTPPIFQEIEQSIYPPIQLGWSTRRKSTHFNYYADLAQDLASLLGCDPWLFTPLMRVAEDIDFLERKGFEGLAVLIDDLLQENQKKYAQYQIHEPPFAVVKADNGTYGMGVMMVKSGEELRQLNRKQRSKMAFGKGGQAVRQVLVQEGIYTFETTPAGAVAEPVVYMMGSCVVGGFYRAHQNKGIDENLNAPGMNFEPLPFETPCNLPCGTKNGTTTLTNQFYVYGVIARLAALAAAQEVGWALAQPKEAR